MGRGACGAGNVERGACGAWKVESGRLNVAPAARWSRMGSLRVQVSEVSSPSKIEGVRGSMNTIDTANDEGEIRRNHTPPARSFSINGLRLTNVKTSFAAGFGLHHWSILEGEFVAAGGQGTPCPYKAPHPRFPIPDPPRRRRSPLTSPLSPLPCISPRRRRLFA